MASKLEQLAKIEGYNDTMALLEASVTESIVPSICINADCDYVIGMEPDQDRGWCESCEMNSVKSALVLADII